MCTAHDRRLGLLLTSSNRFPPSDTSSITRIRTSVVKQMQSVYLFHVRISFLLMGMQMYVAGEMAPVYGLVFAFVFMLNLVCLAERFWDLQLRSLVYWPPACQCVFLVSRLALVTATIVCSVLWIRVGWLYFRCAHGPW